VRRLQAVNLVEELPGRYEGWTLKALAHQLVLGEVVEAEGNGDVKNFNLPDSSSGCSSSESSRASTTTTTSTRSSRRAQNPRGNGNGDVKKFNIPQEGEVKNFNLPQRDVKKFTLDADAQTAVREMLRFGCVQHRARETEGWARYCESEQGASLKAPGFFIASRIADQQEAPYVAKVEEADPEDGRRYIQGKYADLIQH
jgi:hypothetical protein